MKKWSFYTLLMVLAVVHFFGFLKAFVLYPLVEINTPVGVGEGIIWLMASVLFILAAGCYLRFPDIWTIPGSMAILVSQFLVVSHWSDARFMTTANVLVLLLILSEAPVFHRTPKKTPSQPLHRTNTPHVHPGPHARHQRRLVQH